MCFVVDLQVAAAMCAAVPLISCALMEATQSDNFSLSLPLSLSLALFVGSAHSESGMSDIWSTMCPYDGWACSTEVHTSR